MIRGWSPSTANRWMRCAGSVLLSEPYLKQQTEPDEAALEGEAAHFVAEKLIREGILLDIGEACPNGITVDEEMREAAKEYAAAVPSGAQVEVRVSLDKISYGMKGIIDAVYTDGQHLHVYDYKYGHRKVEEFENWQLLTETLGLPLEGVTQISFHIVQPRCYQADAVRTWTISIQEYMTAYVPSILKQASIVGARSKFTQTGDHCRYCPAAHACPTLGAVAGEVAERTKEADARELTPAALARELNALHRSKERLEARLLGLEQQAEQAIRAGTPVPGYTLSPKAGRPEWTVPHATVIRLAKLSGLDVSKPPAALTPSQAIKAGLSTTLVDTLSRRKDTGVKLTKVDLNQIRKAFKK